MLIKKSQEGRMCKWFGRARDRKRRTSLERCAVLELFAIVGALILAPLPCAGADALQVVCNPMFWAPMFIEPRPYIDRAIGVPHLWINSGIVYYITVRWDTNVAELRLDAHASSPDENYKVFSQKDDDEFIILTPGRGTTAAKFGYRFDMNRKSGLFRKTVFKAETSPELQSIEWGICGSDQKKF